ncbi:MAG: S46 family peptidase, partial [Melioribacteraceae bacterium]|nr:S46 family peptidase [Melioribacteraceae bacterium]
MLKINRSLLIVSLLFIYACATTQEVTQNQFLQQNSSNEEWLNLDTVKAGKFDTGKMWTFEHAPIDYWQKTYGFKADEDWLLDVQMSTLKFASWCTASFVSEDGLIMTNHHCIDFVSSLIQEQGENIAENGFYAETLEDERKIANVYVDQLVIAEDVSDQILEAYELGKTDHEKQKNKNDAISALEKQYSEETGLNCTVTELYNGGSYSMYCYRRYTDVRVVYFNPRSVGLYGGDPDNFTYPRYNADFAFLRVYDETGKPLKTENYFKWSLEGAQLEEPLFVVGNPGSTQRLQTVSQLEFMRDFTFRNTSFLLNEYLVKLYYLMNKFPEKAEVYEGTAFFVSNSAKVYREYLAGLRNPYFIQRKKVFEDEFVSKVNSNPGLKSRFGHIWRAIDESNQQLRKTAAEYSAFTLSNQTKPGYFNMADALLNLADQLAKPESERDEQYKGESLQSTIETIWPDNFDEDLEKVKLVLAIDFMELNLGTDNRWVKLLKNGKSSEDAVNELLS